MISAGNIADNDRCSLFFMDYAHRRRLKMLGRIRTEHAEDVDANILEKVALPGYQAEIERVFFIRVEAFDWNCPQHITPRYSEDEIATRFGHVLEAFRYGAPPHGGMGLGLDRLCAMLGGVTSIREVIAFPKTQSGVDPMFDAPDVITQEQLKELHISIVEPD